MPVVALVVLTAVLFIAWPQDALEAWDYFTMQRIPAVQHKTTVELAPGSVQLPRLSDVTIEVLQPEEGVEHQLFIRRDALWQQLELSDYQRSFTGLDYSFDYFVITPYATSDTFRVEIFEKPMITRLDLRYEYPAYTGMAAQSLPDAVGQIEALVGTTVHYRFEANNPLQEALCSFDDGTVQRPQRAGKSSYSGSFILERSGQYQFVLTDMLGSTSAPAWRSISALPDKAPQLAFTIPGRDTTITQNMTLPVRLEGSDDFGLQNLQLHYQVNGQDEQHISLLPTIAQSMVSFDYIFDLSQMTLIPGDEVLYWASIQDNSPQKQTTETQRFRARFPSIEEIYEEFARADEERQQQLESTRKEARQLQEDFEEKRRDMMRKEEASWEDKEEIQSLLQEQEQLNDDVQQMTRDYQQMIEQMQQNKALSEETLEKMERIRELMEEITSEELLQAMEEMQKKIDTMQPEDLKKAMEQMKFSMDEFVEKLDTTLELLEDIKKEQALQKALNIAREMEKMQQELNNRTEAGEDLQELAQDQQQISDKLEALQDQMMEMQKMLDQPKDAALRDSLQQAMETAMQDSLQQNMEQSSQQMQQGDRQQAMQQQQDASQTLKRLREQLENMQSMMNSSMQMDNGAAIDAAIRRMLIFSDIHEAAAARYSRDPFVILPDLIAGFEAMNLALQELYSTPMIVITLGPKFMYDSSATGRAYRELFSEINDAQTRRVPEFLDEIQKGLNLMVFDLMQAKSNSQQSGSGGMQSLMQSMQQMSQQQMMMNMMTQQMMQQMMQNGGKMNNQTRQQAQRLARQEEQLAENIRRMLQTNEAAQKQTGALQQLADDLEDIARNLRQNRIDQSLIDKQERILSRLLDAQKSIHKREFSNERKAETSDREWSLPSELKLQFDAVQHRALLKDDVQNYPLEYRELIQEYLKRLNEKLQHEGGR
jgi:hypothetical protein